MNQRQENEPIENDLQNDWIKQLPTMDERIEFAVFSTRIQCLLKTSYESMRLAYFADDTGCLYSPSFISEKATTKLIQLICDIESKLKETQSHLAEMISQVDHCQTDRGAKQ